MRQILKTCTVFGMLASAVLPASLARAQQKPASATPPKAAWKASPSPAKQSAPKASTSTAAPPSKPGPTAPVNASPQQKPADTGKRRDPFRTLIAEKKAPEAEAPVKLPPGKKGLVIEQLQLQGIAQAVDGSWIAVVDNKTKRAYFLHEKDQLYNGTVSKVTKDEIVFMENPPGSSTQATPRQVVKRVTQE
jgi:hypothetical protein